MDDTPFEEEELENNLGDIMEMLRGLDMNSRWRTIATRLRLRSDSMNTIAANNNNDVERCFQLAITDWLKLNYNHQENGRPSWRKLAKAIHDIDGRFLERFTQGHLAGIY